MVPDMRLPLYQVPGLNETTAPAPANPSSNITILGFTWSPTRAVFPTFQNGSSALLSVRSVFCMLKIDFMHPPA